MKKKLVITLLLTALATTSLAGCEKKETANVPAGGTEVVAEINTETEVEEVVVEETETEEIVVAETEEDTESESDTEVVAKNDDKDSDKAETKANGKTESSKNESDSSNKNNSSTSTNSNAQTEQPSAPVETPVETPAVETPVETPAETPAPTVCPYGPMYTWIDFGDGWWGYYMSYGNYTGDEMLALKDDLTAYAETNFYNQGLCDDDGYSEYVGTWDDTGDVHLTKLHFVPTPM